MLHLTATRLETKEHEKLRRIAKKNHRSIAGELRQLIVLHINQSEGKSK